MYVVSIFFYIYKTLHYPYKQHHCSYLCTKSLFFKVPNLKRKPWTQCLNSYVTYHPDSGALIQPQQKVLVLKSVLK